MGQGSSAEAAPPSLEQLSHALAHRFAQKCYTPLELYCFTSVFRSLADTESGIRYWSESTLCRFLELPDALGAGSVVFHMASYLGAFPFPSQAPAILTNEALVKVVTILTERYGAVIKKRGREMWLREIYRSLAVYDRGVEMGMEKGRSSKELHGGMNSGGNSQGFDIDKPEDEGEGEEQDDDELVLAALDSMDAIEVFKHGEKSNVHHSIIPTDNLLKLVELLLLIAPIDPQESLSIFASQLSDDRIADLRRTANVIVSSFGVEDNPGITFRTFTAVVSSSLPYLFNGLNPLFERFLFAKDFDLSKRKSDSQNALSHFPVIPEPKTLPPPEPILREPGEILDQTLLSQLSFFIKGSNLFRRLRPLYSGNTSGFSMGSFEKAVFNWRAPSILLVSGTLLSSTPTNARERSFADSLPPKRLPNSLSHTPSLSQESTTLTFGAYIPVHWKQTHKTCFSDSSTLLFQLSPVHDVFAASSFSTDYAYFNKPPTRPSGISFGTPIPQQTHHFLAQSHISLGPVSLHLDDALEFGVFTHISAGGGSFHSSQLPCRKYKDWQDRFEIESLEIWGCGGDAEAEQQRKQWAWEEREAEMRRRVNLGTGDIDADRELLKMAGLIGEDRSGGSMG